MKMKAAELEISEADLEAGTIVGGFLSAGIVDSLFLTRLLGPLAMMESWNTLYSI
jgi:hypothetical protein